MKTAVTVVLNTGFEVHRGGPVHEAQRASQTLSLSSASALTATTCENTRGILCSRMLKFGKHLQGLHSSSPAWALPPQKKEFLVPKSQSAMMYTNTKVNLPKTQPH